MCTYVCPNRLHEPFLTWQRKNKTLLGDFAGSVGKPTPASFARTACTGCRRLHLLPAPALPTPQTPRNWRVRAPDSRGRSRHVLFALARIHKASVIAAEVRGAPGQNRACFSTRSPRLKRRGTPSRRTPRRKGACPGIGASTRDQARGRTTPRWAWGLSSVCVSLNSRFPCGCCPCDLCRSLGGPSPRRQETVCSVGIMASPACVSLGSGVGVEEAPCPPRGSQPSSALPRCPEDRAGE